MNDFHDLVPEQPQISDWPGLVRVTYARERRQRRAYAALTSTSLVAMGIAGGLWFAGTGTPTSRGPVLVQVTDPPPPTPTPSTSPEALAVPGSSPTLTPAPNATTVLVYVTDAPTSVPTESSAPSPTPTCVTADEPPCEYGHVGHAMQRVASDFYPKQDAPVEVEQGTAWNSAVDVRYSDFAPQLFLWDDEAPTSGPGSIAHPDCPGYNTDRKYTGRGKSGVATLTWSYTFDRLGDHTIYLDADSGCGGYWWGRTYVHKVYFHVYPKGQPPYATASPTP